MENNKQELVVKAKQIGNDYAEKILEGEVFSHSERSALNKIISAAFADGYINGYSAICEFKAGAKKGGEDA